MARVQIVGMTVVMKKLKDNVTLDDVKRVVERNGSEMRQKMKKNADFKKGYQTGTTKRSIALEIKSNGLIAEAGPGTEYSPYLEYGTRFMDAQPFVKPAYNEQKQKFKSDMDKLTR